ncbi:sensitivity to high expression protein she9 [Basidiobolus ranarum]|uniref:Sensitive to high expression protein 9, mitochondrial n=1 Tax=Basidiobolus ranarum TaxID=34480 RepID=A0ABR2WZE0_9FUNG
MLKVRPVLLGSSLRVSLAIREGISRHRVLHLRRDVARFTSSTNNTTAPNDSKIKDSAQVEEELKKILEDNKTAMNKLAEVETHAKPSIGTEQQLSSMSKNSLENNFNLNTKKSFDEVFLQLQKHPLFGKIRGHIPENVTNGELTKLIQDPFLKINGYWTELTATPPKERLVKIGKIINDVTGYSAVEKLKNKVIQAEKNLVIAKDQLEEVKLAYEKSIEERATCQRDINSLLQRKHTWSDADVVKFTSLYRTEHINEQAEQAAKIKFKEFEKNVDHQHNELVDAIRMRYHEEQIWSDKIRGASTYGTWTLMGIHVCLFILVQTIFEPKKRRRLQEHFDKKLSETSEEEQLALSKQVQPVMSAIDDQQARIDNLVEEYSKLQNELKTLASYISPNNEPTYQPMLDYIEPLSPPPRLGYNDPSPETVDAVPNEPNLPGLSSSPLALNSADKLQDVDNAFVAETQAISEEQMEPMKDDHQSANDYSPNTVSTEDLLLDEPIMSESLNSQVDVEPSPVHTEPSTLSWVVGSFYNPHATYQYTQKDVTLLTLESAVAGSLITAIIAYLLNR